MSAGPFRQFTGVDHLVSAATTLRRVRFILVVFAAVQFAAYHPPGAIEPPSSELIPAQYQELDRFDARRPFGPWLHRIVVNRAIDWARAGAVGVTIVETPAARAAVVAPLKKPRRVRRLLTVS